MDAATHRHTLPTFDDFSDEKKDRSGHWGWLDLSPVGVDRGHPQWPFLSLWRTKKNSGEPKKSFIMPQKSILFFCFEILMPQTRF
jgi:hypothetical protein